MAVAVLDIVGTLVDTNSHHAIAWYRAFRQHGFVLPIWRIQGHIGMGGDQLVGALTDERTEDEHGDDIRSSEKTPYFQLIEEVEPMECARELIEELKGRRGGGQGRCADDRCANRRVRRRRARGSRRGGGVRVGRRAVPEPRPDAAALTPGLRRAGSDWRSPASARSRPSAVHMRAAS
jgi:beta-phosphoglucomutase-like phosphatase (HAD superfamily)